jgi:TusA-related sulfurtransferase
MSTTIDARGLSCPQPVILALKEVQAISKGEITVLVDTVTSKENVIRALTAKGWQIKEVTEEQDSCRVTMIRS